MGESFIHRAQLEGCGPRGVSHVTGDITASHAQLILLPPHSLSFHAPSADRLPFPTVHCECFRTFGPDD